ncbi:hypothetical protein [Methanobrevibacter sp. DSM 116169]|uniref:hypothetical protein n=1 Tax=Methanobrevibacter sp. DSM 116169 TaxID=3242727 RepID=UPI0038FCA727
MDSKPILVIKTVDGNNIGVRARIDEDFIEHEIVLNSVLAYYWRNDLPAVSKFIELFESVIKRTINELMPHKNLFLKYQIKANDELDKASEIKIKIMDVNADGIDFRLDGKEIVLKGIDGKQFNEEDEEEAIYEEIFEKNIETPDIVLNKYKERN